MGDEIDPKLSFATVFGAAGGRNHDAGIVDQDVKRIMTTAECAGELPTEIGKTAAPMIDAISNWGEQYLGSANPRNL